MSDDPFCLTSPEVRARIPRPAPTQPGDRDPYRVPGPAVVSFSGGRTSGYLLRRVLDAYNGRLPPDVHVVFANTGEEDVRTLDFVHRCSVEWGVHITWVEYHDECEGRWREVDYATASRGGEPFARLLDRKGALPNGRMRFCTQELKLRPMRGFMRAQGYGDDWTNVVGLRWDEPGRVSTLRARDSAWDVVCPLYDARVSKADVMSWWAAQPFDLTTPSYAGNCVACFLKGRTLRDRAARGVGAMGASRARRRGEVHPQRARGLRGAAPARRLSARAPVRRLRRRLRRHLALRLHRLGAPRGRSARHLLRALTGH